MTQSSNLFKNIDRSFAEDRAEIESYLNNPVMAGITEHLLTTERNPYSYLPDEYAGDIDTARGLRQLLSVIHHAVVDDGDICFPVVNGAPRMRFVSKWDCLENPKHVLKSHEGRWSPTITFPINTLDEYIVESNKYFEKDIKRCFLLDAKTHGLEFAKRVYSKYNIYNVAWEHEV